MGEYVKKYVPVPGNVVINPCVDKKPENIGIISLKENDAKLQRGLVLNLWPGADEFDLDFKKGDMVYFIGSKAVDVPYMKTNLKIVAVDNIMGKEE